jgi:hypothetical protein
MHARFTDFAFISGLLANVAYAVELHELCAELGT